MVLSHAWCVTVANRHENLTQLSFLFGWYKRYKAPAISLQQSKGFLKRLGMNDIIDKACEVDCDGYMVLEYLLLRSEQELCIIGL